MRRTRRPNSSIELRVHSSRSFLALFSLAQSLSSCCLRLSFRRVSHARSCGVHCFALYRILWLSLSDFLSRTFSLSVFPSLLAPFFCWLPFQVKRNSDEYSAGKISQRECYDRNRAALKQCQTLMDQLQQALPAPIPLPTQPASALTPPPPKPPSINLALSDSSPPFLSMSSSSSFMHSFYIVIIRRSAFKFG